MKVNIAPPPETAITFLAQGGAAAQENLQGRFSNLPLSKVTRQATANKNSWNKNHVHRGQEQHPNLLGKVDPDQFQTQSNDPESKRQVSQHEQTAEENLHGPIIWPRAASHAEFEVVLNVYLKAAIRKRIARR
jgi:hypothetical protein